jgi:spore germination protein KB
VISNKQGIALIFLFILDSSIILPIGAEAGKDVWIMLLLTILITIPVILMYIKILPEGQDRDFFDIINITFGKTFGKILSLLLIWFSFHLAAITLRDFSEFIITVTLPNTPKVIIIFMPTLLCLWFAKEGIEVIGRFSELWLNIFPVIIITMIILLIPVMDIRKLQPAMEKGIIPILDGTFSAFTFPFGETVVFIMLLSSAQSKKDAAKVYLIGLLFAGSLLIMTKTTEMLVLGERVYLSIYFPAYSTVARIKIGDFLQRLEIIVGLLFTVASIVKVALCLLASCKGLAKIFEQEDYRFIVTPMALLMFCLANILYENIMELVGWTSQVWRYYALPFQIGIPLLISIGMRIRRKKLKNEIN